MNYSEITPYIKELAALSDASNHIAPEMYAQHDVKRGLRDINGNGVVAGLTEVSHIKAKEIDAEGNAVPCAGQLYYRGVNVRSLVKGFVADNHRVLKKQCTCFCFQSFRPRMSLMHFASSFRYIAPCRHPLFVI